MVGKNSKTVKSAVIVTPDENTWAPIQEIRKQYDKAYERWPPHINMLYPFVPEESFNTASVKLSTQLSSFGGFTLILDEFDYFSFGNSCTFFLKPRTTPPNALTKLQTKLLSLFPFCDDLNTKSEDKKFHPHLTLGQCRTDNAKKMLADLKRKWQPITVHINTISLIARGDPPKDKFQTLRIISLLSAATAAPVEEVPISPSTEDTWSSAPPTQAEDWGAPPTQADNWGTEWHGSTQEWETEAPPQPALPPTLDEEAESIPTKPILYTPKASYGSKLSSTVKLQLAETLYHKAYSQYQHQTGKLLGIVIQHLIAEDLEELAKNPKIFNKLMKDAQDLLSGSYHAPSVFVAPIVTPSMLLAQPQVAYPEVTPPEPALPAVPRPPRVPLSKSKIKKLSRGRGKKYQEISNDSSSSNGIPNDYSAFIFSLDRHFPAPSNALENFAKEQENSMNFQQDLLDQLYQDQQVVPPLFDSYDSDDGNFQEVSATVPIQSLSVPIRTEDYTEEYIEEEDISSFHDYDEAEPVLDDLIFDDPNWKFPVGGQESDNWNVGTDESDWGNTETLPETASEERLKEKYRREQEINNVLLSFSQEDIGLMIDFVENQKSNLGKLPKPVKKRHQKLKAEKRELEISKEISYEKPMTFQDGQIIRACGICHKEIFRVNSKLVKQDRYFKVKEMLEINKHKATCHQDDKSIDLVVLTVLNFAGVRKNRREKKQLELVMDWVRKEEIFTKHRELQKEWKFYGIFLQKLTARLRFERKKNYYLRIPSAFVEKRNQSYQEAKAHEKELFIAKNDSK